ncbi:MAG: hypothetical protein KH304_10725 [Clostridium sp.]|nr:hypothetical protein [Clostridium sp.]
MRISGLDVPCMGRRSGNPLDGYDYDCEYENSVDIFCDDCVCNYGFYNPRTGKRINWFLRVIQRRRALKYYKYINSLN